MIGLPGSPVARLRHVATRVRERGDTVECPICGGTFRRFLPYAGREGAVCPGCGSAERHRLLWLWLCDEDRLKGRVLAFGPDDATDERLRRLSRVRYLSSDIDASQAMVAADITALPFDDDTFDIVLCSHVLEHVEDEAGALAQLRRVLRPNGWAAVMVPVDRTVEATLEDPSATTPQARLERFGQIDHVRLYGRDVAQRLGAHEVIDPLTRFGAERESRHGLRRQDRFGPDEIYLLRAQPR
jgi:SAM-dependent methyltransferase